MRTNALISLQIVCLFLSLVGCGGSSTSNTIYGSSSTNTDDGLVMPNITSIAYGDGVFVAIGSGGGNPLPTDVPLGPWVVTSVDGVSWKIQDSGDSGNNGGSYISLAYGANGFIATDDQRGVFRSPDGITWTKVVQLPAGNQYYVTWDGAEYLSAIQGGVVTSTDGITWKTVKTAVPFPASVTKVSSAYYGIGVSGDGQGTEIVTSTDLVHWASTYSGVDSIDLRALLYAGGQFIAVGSNGAIVTSPDGSNWTALTPVTSDCLLQLAYNGTTYVAVGLTDAVSSPDGVTWTVATAGNNSPGGVGSIAAASGGSIVFVGGNTTETTVDGAHWTIGTIGP